MFANGISFTWALLALPVIWLVEAVVLGVTLPVAAIAVVVRDTQHLLMVVMGLWFYATPIFYELTQVPVGTRSWFVLNPMTTIVTAHRRVTLEGSLPDNWGELGLWSLAGAALIAVSLPIFKSLEDVIIDQT